MVHQVEGSYWYYAPTKGASIVFAVLWAISGSLHIYQNMIKYRAYRIAGFLPWAALLFVVGFCFNEYGAYHYDNLAAYITSRVLIFCAPPVYAAACYFIFGRALYYLPYLALLHPGRVLSTFLGIDGLVEVISSNGIALVANRGNTPATVAIGLRLVKAALFLQIALFLAFIGLVVHFHRSVIRAGVLVPNIRTIIYLLYTTSFFILFRSTFRTATVFYAYSSPANASEAFFYVFEICPMLIATYTFNVFPPAKYLPRNYRTYLAKDGKTELEGPGKIDKRNFFMTVIDPVDLVGILRGTDRKNRFWEEDGIGGPKKEANSVEIH